MERRHEAGAGPSACAPRSRDRSSWRAFRHSQFLQLSSTRTTRRLPRRQTPVHHRGSGHCTGARHRRGSNHKAVVVSLGCRPCARPGGVQRDVLLMTCLATQMGRRVRSEPLCRIGMNLPTPCSARNLCCRPIRIASRASREHIADQRSPARACTADRSDRVRES